MKANVGDMIEFTREEQTRQGKVIAVYENSVAVDMDWQKSLTETEGKPNRTVVNHKRYSIINS